MAIDNTPAAPWRTAFPTPADAPPAVREELSERALAAGAYLFHQGDPVDAVFVVVAGTMRLERHTPDGQRIVIHRAQPGDSLAEAALFADSYHCDAVAETSVRAIAYPKALMLSLLGSDAALARAMLATLSGQVQQLRTRLELRNLRPARLRVRTYLELLADANGEVVFDRSLKQVAGEIGLTHEAFYRALAALAEAGEIARDGHRIVVKTAASV